LQYEKGYEEDGPTFGEIWTKLSTIDCTEYVEQKKIPGKNGGRGFSLTYLSWTWAYTKMVENYPEFQYHFHDNEVHNDGSVTVHVVCNIGQVSRSMWLPVMDNRNNSVEDPSSREISDAKMRCLVKCIALFGLGLYIFAGEDVPRDTDEVPPKAASKAKPTVTSVNDEPSESSIEKAKAIDAVLTVEMEGETDNDNLRKVWGKNKEGLEWLGNNHPDMFTDLLLRFKAKSAELSTGDN
jgi:hypothetical protein